MAVKFIILTLYRSFYNTIIVTLLLHWSLFFCYTYFGYVRCSLPQKRGNMYENLYFQFQNKTNGYKRKPCTGNGTAGALYQ